MFAILLKGGESKMKKYVFTSIALVIAVAAYMSTSTSATTWSGVGNVGNGAGSTNTATSTKSDYKKVQQNNKAIQVNSVTNVQNTGENKANKNTGADVGVYSGSAKAKTNITNNANANVAHVSDDCGCEGNGPVGNVGNGADSHNTATSANSSTTKVKQNNFAFQANGVTNVQNTGGNEANKNTGSVWGDSDVGVGSGNAHSTTNITNNANYNEAVVGGN
jgi:hypothetical protein